MQLRWSILRAKMALTPCLACPGHRRFLCTGVVLEPNSSMLNKRVIFGFHLFIHFVDFVSSTTPANKNQRWPDGLGRRSWPALRAKGTSRALAGVSLARVCGVLSPCPLVSVGVSCCFTISITLAAIAVKRDGPSNAFGCRLVSGPVSHW